MRRALLLALVFAAGAAAAPAQPATHVVIIAGIPGEPRFQQAFDGYVTRLHGALVRQHGVPADRIAVLAADPASAPGIIGTKSTKGEVAKAIARLATVSREDDRILLVLIGHGSGRGAEAKLNIPGPDLTAAELARALEPLAPRLIAVVHTGSASGDFVRALSAPNRVIITATASAMERNETIFPEHFVAAFAEGGADTDKDGRLSLLEAYTYATRETARAYERGSRLPTEHARLDDNGDGEGSADAGAAGKDGALARRFVIGRSAAASRAASGDTVLARLIATRTAIEGDLEALRARKARMAAADYERELEALLVRLAETQAAIRAREGTP